MDNRDEVKAFLGSRRAKTATQQAGLEHYNRNRRVPGLTDVPAFVGNGSGDVLAANPLAQALYAPMFDDPTRPANHARFRVPQPRARDFWRDWYRIASDTVAMMRTEAGRDPYDLVLTDLVGELGTQRGASETCT